jgi:hypothetical protein
MYEALIIMCFIDKETGSQKLGNVSTVTQFTGGVGEKFWNPKSVMKIPPGYSALLAMIYASEK